MLDLTMFSDMTSIIPATPAVWCDPGVRIDAEAGVWCDVGARIAGEEVWCDPGVRVELETRELEAPRAALAWETVDLWAGLAPALPWLDEPALPRFVREQARVALPAIPTQLTFEERVTQRCLMLRERLGWDLGVSMSLLDAVLEAGTPDHVLVRVVEHHEEAHCLRTLHAAWELRRQWFEDGPLSGWMTWHHAVVLVTCWHEEAPEIDELVHWLDEAFRCWHLARPYSKWWIFHEELVDWLDEDGPDALLYAEYPWDEQLLDDHTPAPRW